MLGPDEQQELVFWGNTKSQLRSLPSKVRQAFAFDLQTLQRGKTPGSEKVLHGFGGSGVRELTCNYNTNTYRTVVYVKERGIIYVVDVFEKKSHKGGKLPREIDKRIRNRIREIKSQTH